MEYAPRFGLMPCFHLCSWHACARQELTTGWQSQPGAKFLVHILLPKETRCHQKRSVVFSTPIYVSQMEGLH